MTRLTNRSTARPLVAFAALLGLLMLAGCGSSAPTSTAGSDTTTQTDTPEDTSETSAPAGDGGTSSACELLTLDEVTEAVGVEATATLGNDQLQGMSACNFNDAEGVPIAAFSITRSDSPISPSAAYDSFTEASEEVAGLGDRAQYLSTPPTLYVLEGDTLISLSVVAAELDDTARQEAAIELARLVRDRLQ